MLLLLRNSIVRAYLPLVLERFPGVRVADITIIYQGINHLQLSIKHKRHQLTCRVYTEVDDVYGYSIVILYSEISGYISYSVNPTIFHKVDNAFDQMFQKKTSVILS